jgi:hypothetical protein
VAEESIPPRDGKKAIKVAQQIPTFVFVIMIYDKTVIRADMQSRYVGRIWR